MTGVFLIAAALISCAALYGALRWLPGGDYRSALLLTFPAVFVPIANVMGRWPYAVAFPLVIGLVALAAAAPLVAGFDSGRSPQTKRMTLFRVALAVAFGLVCWLGWPFLTRKHAHLDPTMSVFWVYGLYASLGFVAAWGAGLLTTRFFRPQRAESAGPPTP